MQILILCKVSLVHRDIAFDDVPCLLVTTLSRVIKSLVFHLPSFIGLGFLWRCNSLVWLCFFSFVTYFQTPHALEICGSWFASLAFDQFGLVPFLTNLNRLRIDFWKGVVIWLRVWITANVSAFGYSFSDWQRCPSTCLGSLFSSLLFCRRLGFMMSSHLFL